MGVRLKVALLRQLFETILFIIHHIDKATHLFSTCDVGYFLKKKKERKIQGKCAVGYFLKKKKEREREKVEKIDDIHV